MRRLLIAAAILVTGSCGGSPAAPSMTAPTATAPLDRPVALGPGPYTLRITLSTSGMPTCSQGGPCVSVSLCSGDPSATTASLDVLLERSGDEATITAAGGARPLTISLHTMPTSVTGSIAGSARDARGMQVDVTGTLSGTGSGIAGVAVSGNIDGQVSLGGGGCSNNGHVWSLSPR